MEWQTLDYHERVSAVAHYRLKALVDLHSELAVAEAVKRKQDGSHPYPSNMR